MLSSVEHEKSFITSGPGCYIEYAMIVSVDIKFIRRGQKNIMQMTSKNNVV